MRITHLMHAQANPVDLFDLLYQQKRILSQSQMIKMEDTEENGYRRNGEDVVRISFKWFIRLCISY